MDSVVCPQCQAKNAPNAPWCSQCYVPFDSADDHADELVTVAAASAATDVVVAAPAENESPKLWVCRLCETENEVEASECHKCGVSIFDSIAPRETAAPDPEVVLRSGLMVPGLGYAAVNQTPTGFVAGFLAIAGSATGLAMLIAGAAIAGVAMLIISIAVWVVSAIDAAQMSRGQEMLLQPRVLSVAGAAVVLIILISVAQAFTRANG